MHDRRPDPAPPVQQSFLHDPSLPILLLCPPGARVYQRDNYCSHEAKASYYWYPYDLVVQSGILGGVGEVEVLDSTALRLTGAEVQGRLAGRRFRAILSLMGAACWAEDEAFIRQVHETTHAPIFVSGDVVCAQPREALERLPFVTGILMDYTSRDLANYLEGGPTQDEALFLRDREVARPRASRAYTIPVPRWDLFPPGGYRLPFLKRQPFASVAASFGCPYACEFCTAAPLVFRLRELDNLFDELRFLARAGYREIHFKDLSFGIDRRHYTQLLERLVSEKLGFSFNCLSRADALDPELLQLMSAAGGRLIHIGVESASPSSLERVRKGVGLDDVKRAVEDCRHAGIEVLASYVLGFPWESRADLERTIDLAVSLDTEYASFNSYAVRTTWPPPGSAAPLPGGRDYDLAEVLHLAYRRFYFRPSYLWRRLRAPVTLTGLRLGVASGWELFRRHVVPGGVARGVATDRDRSPA
jgi:anaerobic magnesium-protoporphyrin IX monomethyl ester cyclase